MLNGFLKVVIVDDEYLVRDLLKKCINWNELGLDIAGEASGAHEALELVDAVNPDIIFTDICMPFMDGIEFSKLVFEKYPHIKIVVLTGYEEFEYAKRSIKVGIADFLLKPINDDEIKKVALNMRDRIEAERTHRDEYNKLKELLEDNLPYLKEKFLNELIQGCLDADEIKDKLLYFHINMCSDRFQVGLMEVTHSETDAYNGAEEKLLLGIQCMELVKQYFRNDPYVIIFFDNNQKIVIINTDMAFKLTECCETLKSMLINRIKGFACIGIGNLHISCENIRLSYKEALYALNFKAILGKNQVINYSDIDFAQKERLHFESNQIEELEFYLKAGLRSKAVELIDKVYSGYDLNHGDAIESFRVVASNFISVVLSVISETGLRIKDVFDESSEPFGRVFKIDTLPEMKAYIVSVVGNTISLTDRLKTKKVNKTIKDIKDYISENISDNELSLSSVACRFFLNPSYMSRIFKQETDQTFVEYLTRVRMDRASRLLKETDLKAYEIADKVGIQDPHYFSICFKKYTGMSINDYKKI